MARASSRPDPSRHGGRRGPRARPGRSHRRRSRGHGPSRGRRSLSRYVAAGGDRDREPHRIRRPGAERRERVIDDDDSRPGEARSEGGLERAGMLRTVDAGAGDEEEVRVVCPTGAVARPTSAAIRSAATSRPWRFGFAPGPIRPAQAHAAGSHRDGHGLRGARVHADEQGEFRVHVRMIAHGRRGRVRRACGSRGSRRPARRGTGAPALETRRDPPAARNRPQSNTRSVDNPRAGGQPPRMWITAPRVWTNRRRSVDAGRPERGRAGKPTGLPHVAMRCTDRPLHLVVSGLTPALLRRTVHRSPRRRTTPEAPGHAASKTADEGPEDQRRRTIRRTAPQLRSPPS